LRAGSAKRVASNAAIAAGESVPVKEVHKIGFKGKDVRFVQGEALDQ